MKIHQLKAWPLPFQAIVDGRKPYEIRQDDRGFEEGDVLFLHEYDPADEAYRPRTVKALVTYKTGGGDWGVPHGMCVLGIRVLDIFPVTGDATIRDLAAALHISAR